MSFVSADVITFKIFPFLDETSIINLTSLSKSFHDHIWGSVLKGRNIRIRSKGYFVTKEVQKIGDESTIKLIRNNVINVSQYIQYLQCPDHSLYLFERNHVFTLPFFLENYKKEFLNFRFYLDWAKQRGVKHSEGTRQDPILPYIPIHDVTFRMIARSNSFLRLFISKRFDELNSCDPRRCFFIFPFFRVMFNSNFFKNKRSKPVLAKRTIKKLYYFLRECVVNVQPELFLEGMEMIVPLIRCKARGETTMISLFYKVFKAKSSRHLLEEGTRFLIDNEKQFQKNLECICYPMVRERWCIAEFVVKYIFSKSEKISNALLQPKFIQTCVRFGYTSLVKFLLQHTSHSSPAQPALSPTNEVFDGIQHSWGNGREEHLRMKQVLMVHFLLDWFPKPISRESPFHLLERSKSEKDSVKKCFISECIRVGLEKKHQVVLEQMKDCETQSVLSLSEVGIQEILHIVQGKRDDHLYRTILHSPFIMPSTRDGRFFQVSAVDVFVEWLLSLHQRVVDARVYGINNDFYRNLSFTSPRIPQYLFLERLRLLIEHPKTMFSLISLTRLLRWILEFASYFIYRGVQEPERMLRNCIVKLLSRDCLQTLIGSNEVCDTVCEVVVDEMKRRNVSRPKKKTLQLIQFNKEYMELFSLFLFTQGFSVPEKYVKVLKKHKHFREVF